MNLSGLLPLIQSATGLAPLLQPEADPPSAVARLQGPQPGGAPLVLGLPDTAKAATLAALAQPCTIRALPPRQLFGLWQAGET